MNILIKKYEDYVEKKDIVFNKSQYDLLLKLQDYFFNKFSLKYSFFDNFIFFKGKKKLKCFRGFYVWGGVGQGKSFLVDLFFDSLESDRKVRFHFNEFLSFIHTNLKLISGTANPIEVLVKDLSNKYDVLVLDEFYVSDITDAMLLVNFLKEFFNTKYSISLVTTSNITISNLYKSGFQKQHFNPAIKLLLLNMTEFELVSGCDYRFRGLTDSKLFYFDETSETLEKLKLIFIECSKNNYTMNGYVIVCKRNVNCLYKSVNYVWFDFFDLFECPRSQLDYLELSNKFGTVFISSVPNLCDDREDVIRRFILLVDVFYDRKVNLILSFIDSLDSLYSGTKLSFEFLRTKSRLAEMQSDEYRFSERKFYS